MLQLRRRPYGETLQERDLLEVRQSRTPKSGVIGKRVRGIVCASCFPCVSTALPTVDVRVGNQIIRALVDTGCSRTIVARKLVNEVRPSRDIVLSVDGSILRCGTGYLELAVQDRSIRTRVLVLDSLLSQFDLVLGMDVIQEMGGQRWFGHLGRPSYQLGVC